MAVNETEIVTENSSSSVEVLNTPAWILIGVSIYIFFLVLLIIIKNSLKSDISWGCTTSSNPESPNDCCDCCISCATSYNPKYPSAGLCGCCGRGGKKKTNFTYCCENLHESCSESQFCKDFCPCLFCSWCSYPQIQCESPDCSQVGCLCFTIDLT